MLGVLTHALKARVEYVTPHSRKAGGSSVEGISATVGALSAIITGLAGAGYVLGLIALAWPVYRRITGDAYTALYAVSLVPKTVVIGQGIRIMLGTALMTWGPRIALYAVALIGIPIAVALVGEMNRVILQVVTAAIVLCSLWLLGKLEASAGRLETTSLFNFLYLKSGPPPPFKAALVFCGLVGGAIVGVGVVVYAFQYEAGWQTFLIVLVAVFLINVIFGVPYAVSLSIDAPLPKVRMTRAKAENGGDSSQTEGRLVAHSEGVFYVFEGPILIAVPDAEAKIIKVP
jgi:hypothetical protein